MNADTIYVLFDLEESKYVALDPGSGGYPYCTELRHATFFATEEDAAAYWRLFHARRWAVRKVVAQP